MILRKAIIFKEINRNHFKIWNLMDRETEDSSLNEIKEVVKDVSEKKTGCQNEWGGLSRRKKKPKSRLQEEA